MKKADFQFNEGSAFASLVFGVLGILICFLPSWPVPGIGIICSTMGLGFGIVGLKTQKRGMAVVGIIVGGIGLLANSMLSGLI